MSDKCLINPDRDCYGLIKATEVEKRLIALQERNTESHDRFFNRLEMLEKKDSVQEVQFENMLEKLGGLSDDINDLKADSKEIVSQLPPLTHGLEKVDDLSKDVEELKSKPAKKWESAVEKIIGIVIAAVVGYILANVGL